MTRRATTATNDAERYLDARASWLIRCAYLLTGERTAAEDLAQDTALKIWESWTRVADARDRDAYVARIMVNTLRSQWRRRGPVVTDLSEPRLALAARRGPVGAAADDPMSAVDDADAIWRSMHVLSDRERTVVVLRYWADLDDATIARALRCRRGTVRSLASRGLHRMRHEMGERDADV